MERFYPPNPYQNLPGFDVDITEIALIHKCEYKPAVYDTGYKNGRMYSGFVYCIDGKSEYVCENERFSVAKGEMLFLPPRARYTVVTGKEAPFLHYTLNFTLRDEPERVGVLLPYLSGENILRLTPKDPSLYETALSELLAVWNGKQDGFKLIAKARLYLLFHDYFREYRTLRIDPRDFSQVYEAKRYIDSHFTESITVEFLASLCKLSQTHFRRLFGEVFHTSPIEYQITLRLLRAKDLLKAKVYSIGEIAESCGFSDANYFSRLFKSRVGISPLQYKRNH